MNAASLLKLKRNGRSVQNMNRLKYAFIFILLTLWVSFPAFAAKETSYERVLRTNILRCAYGAADPYISKDMVSGKVKGPMVDIAEAMADQLALKVEWTAEVGYADFAEGLKTGHYDAFCGIMAMAPTRARAVAFTYPLFYAPYFVYVRQSEDRFKTLEDINQPHVKAGVIDGEVFQFMTRKRLPAAQEYSLPNMTAQGQLFVDIANGKADVALHDPLVTALYRRSNPDQIKRLFDEPIEVYSMAFAVMPQEQALRDMLNVSITALQNLKIIDGILNDHGIDGNTLYRMDKPYAVMK